MWSTSIKAYNWGDYINLKLAQFISSKTVIPSRYNRGRKTIAMAGSILPWAITKDTVIWGSGCLDSKDIGWSNVETPLRICAVRGPLTRDVLIKHGIQCPDVYGDPVLLFPRYYNPTIEKTNKVTFIPHISSITQAYETIGNLNVNNEEIVVIHPGLFNTWHEFIDMIISSKVVLSSSLHGIIVSDAYNIPNVWVSFNSEEHPDGNFKFHDYYASVEKSDIKSPVNIKDVDFQHIQAYIKQWQKPHIDLDKLYSVCPFVN